MRKIQSGYRAEPLSKFQKTAAPAPAPEIKWPKIDKQLAEGLILPRSCVTARTGRTVRFSPYCRNL